MAHLGGCSPDTGGASPWAPAMTSCPLVPVCKQLPQRTPSLLPASPGSGGPATGSGEWTIIRGPTGVMEDIEGVTEMGDNEGESGGTWIFVF